MKVSKKTDLSDSRSPDGVSLGDESSRGIDHPLSSVRVVSTVDKLSRLAWSEVYSFCDGYGSITTLRSINALLALQ